MILNLAPTYPEKNGQYAAIISLIIVALPLALFLPISIIVAFAVLMGLRLFFTFIGKASLPVWQIVILAIGLAGLVFFNIYVLWGQEGGTAMLLLFIAIKSFDGGTYRDWQMLLLFSFFLVIGPLLFQQDLLNAIWMVASLGSILLAFAILGKTPTKTAVKQTAFALLISAPFMVVLFFAVPRLPEPLWRIPQNKNEQSGLLSETLSPGSVSELILTNRQIFNAVFEDGFIPKNNQLYWRMMVMPDFDGIAWTVPPVNAIDASDTTPVAGQPIRYSLTLVDQNRRLPALDYPISSGDSARKGYGRTVVADRSYAQLRRVELSSNGQGQTPEVLTENQQYYYTQLPDNNPKTRAWAQKLKEQSRSSEDYIRKTLAYFTENKFEYTLKPPKLDHTKDQIDEFLFRSKRGFCEHYASAFAVSMRAGGLPARVITGYQGGTFYSEGGFWQIKGKDAHAWTEVWLPEKQIWLRVDPTSAVSDRADLGVEDALSEEEQENLLDATGPKSGLWNMVKVNGEFYWQQWVVGFNAEKQRDLFQFLGLGKVSALTIILAISIGGLLAFIPVFLWWRRYARKERNSLTEGFILLKRKLLGEEQYVLALGPMELLDELVQQRKKQQYMQVKPLVEEFIRLNYRSANVNKKAAWRWLKKIKRLRIK